MTATHIVYKSIFVKRKPGLWWIDRMEDAALRTAPKLYDDVVVVTSINDGKHSRGSYHYRDRAIDVRTIGARRGAIVLPAGEGKGVAAQRDRSLDWAQEIRELLGPDFDVLAESDHIHIEYDPE